MLESIYTISRQAFDGRNKFDLPILDALMYDCSLVLLLINTLSFYHQVSPIIFPTDVFIFISQILWGNSKILAQFNLCTYYPELTFLKKQILLL